MGITIGDAILWIRGKNDKLDGDLKQAEGQIGDWGKKIDGIVKGMIGVGVTAAISKGIIAITDNLKELANQSIDTAREYGKQVNQMRLITGLTAEDSSRLIQIADDMELSYGGLSTAIRMYSMQLGRAGVSTQVGIDQLAGLSDEYLRLAPGVERNTFLVQNFGRGGMEMARLMEKGGDAIREMAEAVEDDLILTEEMIKTQEEYRVSVDNLEDALAGLKTQLGLALMPLKTEWNEFLAREVVPILRELIQWFTKLPEPIQLAIVSLVLLAGAGAKAAPSLVGIASIINVLGGGGGIAALGSAITGSLIPALAGIGTTIVGAVLSPVGLLVAAIGLLIFTISTLGPEAWKSLQMLWQIFTAVMKRLSYEISAWARNLSRQVTTWFRDVGRGIVDGIWQGIQEAWESLKANVENALNDLLAWVKDAIEAGSPSGLYKREIGFSMGQGTLQGYVESLQAGMNVLAPELLPGSQAISVGHIEYHGAFSRDELNRLDRRHDKRAEGMLERILK